VAAVIVVAVYAVIAWKSDETQTKIAALEKQIKDKDLATAENEKARQRADEADRLRKAQDQASTETEDIRAEPARKSLPAARPQPDGQKRRDDTATRQRPGAEAVPLVRPASASTSSPVQGTSSAQAPATGATATVAAPEPPKPVPRSSSELVADADRAVATQHYADAIGILKPLADAGNAQAETRLGDVYSAGLGVDRDPAAGERWYEKAALQGDTNAQLKLGAMFANGAGVSQSNNLAYVWYGTAARLGSSSAKTERDKIAPLLQPAEREQLDRLIANKADGMKRP
jgi:TPR repeat protein